jgi:hypothetical protein
MTHPQRFCVTRLTPAKAEAGKAIGGPLMGVLIVMMQLTGEGGRLRRFLRVAPLPCSHGFPQSTKPKKSYTAKA